MMELYQAYGDYRSMMDLTEGMIVACVEALGRRHEAALRRTHHRLHAAVAARVLCRAVRASTSASRWTTPRPCAKKAETEGFPTAGKHPDVLVHHLFEEHVEDQLTGPVFVYDYPASLCPLTKRKRADPNIAERFELYVRGMELANAYTELNDPVTQEATFRQQLAGLPEEDSMAKMDDDFVRALRHGMPPAGGLGVGIDRLIMLLTNTQTIRDVILFPLLRPEKK